jgi:hypothetical protein
MKSIHRWIGIGVAAASLGVLAAPAPAAACGGFFCQRAPADQAGENILFAIEEDGTLVTHVQILYQGSAERFAWILPLPSVPTSLGVGTDALFQQLDERTAPRFDLEGRVEGTCRPTPRCWPDSDGIADAPAERGAWPDAGTAPPADGVTVYLREAVGPYDAVVLGSGSSAELFAWLDENGYDIPAISRPIVAEYVAARHVFVAIRLVSGADTREIQPLVLRYAEGQPCVPIRLTAIATVPDMPIVAYFLADRYATPYNYVRVEPSYDDARLWRDSSYYRTYLSNAVDDAGGRGFVPEFAGTTPSLSLELPDISDLASISDPGEYLRRLRERGFLGDTQLLGILLRFLPPPDSSAGNEAQYYNCLWSEFSHPAFCGFRGDFDPEGLTLALTRQIVEPRREAQALLARHPRTTRLATTMSAEEMTVDPTFVLDEGLPDVSNVHRAALVTECAPAYFDWTAPQRIELPSGRHEVWREGVAYLGTDAELCEDMRAGVFSPWTDPATLRATAARRAIRPAGGGLRCSAAVPRRGVGASVLAVIGLAAAGLALRRKRRC